MGNTRATQSVLRPTGPLTNTSKHKPATRQITQEDYENLYTGKEYNIAYSYATLLVVIFVTLTFSRALPVLYPIAFFYNLVSYWVDKYLMLNFYRRSETFDEHVPLKSLGYMKMALVFHGLISIIIFSNQQIFVTGMTSEDGSKISNDVFIDLYVLEDLQLSSRF